MRRRLIDKIDTSRRLLLSSCRSNKQYLHRQPFRNSPLGLAARFGEVPNQSEVRRSAIPHTGILVAISITAAGAFVYNSLPISTTAAGWEQASTQKSNLSNNDLLISLFGMPATIQPGRPGNLTVDQEAKLREMWSLLHRIFGIQRDVGSATAAADPGPALSRQSTIAESHTSVDKKKKRFSILRKDKKKDKEGDDAPASPPRPGTSAGLSAVDDILSHVDENDKHGQTKAFREAMAAMTPEEIRQTLWAMTKHDHPDGLLLRFLRARKWDVQAAMVMLVSAMRWRLTEAKVDDDVMYRGEEGMIKAGQGESTATSQRDGKDFMDQMKLGKSFLRGVDKAGRPMCIVRTRLHKQGEQSEASLERYTVYTIETTRMFLKPPVDTATIVFDMTDFSLSNMDYTPVKFMIKCFEANYPESLGAVLVHRAPWLFSGVWKVIKGWLDPVVASKIHFTNNIRDLSQFIDESQIIKELGGPVDFTYKYTEPSEDENKCMADTATRDRLQAVRSEIVKNFEHKTQQWVDVYNRSSEATQMDKDMLAYERHEIAKQLRDNYWQLDPYLRARSLYDRTDMVKAFVGEPDEDEDGESFVTAPATPSKVSMDLRRSVDTRKTGDAAKRVNGSVT